MARSPPGEASRGSLGLSWILLLWKASLGVSGTRPITSTS